MARHELWVELADTPGNLAALAGDLAACDANIVHLDVHAGEGDTVIDRLVVQVPDHRCGELAAVAKRCGGTLRPLDDGETRREGDDPDLAGLTGLAGEADDSSGARTAPSDRRAPTTLERLVALPDGGLVRLRHLSPGDQQALLAHHQRCSPATRRDSGFLAGLGSGDGVRRVALTALAGGDIAGVARYDLTGSGTVAQLSVIVEDRHQRRGIGTLLVGELALLAAVSDVHHLRAVVPGGSDAMQRTLRRAGLSFTVRRDGDSVVLDSALGGGLSATA